MNAAPCRGRPKHVMKTFPKTCLSLAVIFLLVGLTNVGGSFVFGILRPAAAVCLMLFFITHLPSGVMDEYDAEEAARVSRADRINGRTAGAAARTSETSGSGTSMAQAH